MHAVGSSINNSKVEVLTGLWLYQMASSLTTGGFAWQLDLYVRGRCLPLSELCMAGEMIGATCLDGDGLHTYPLLALYVDPRTSSKHSKLFLFWSGPAAIGWLGHALKICNVMNKVVAYIYFIIYDILHDLGAWEILPRDVTVIRFWDFPKFTKIEKCRHYC